MPPYGGLMQLLAYGAQDWEYGAAMQKEISPEMYAHIEAMYLFHELARKFGIQVPHGLISQLASTQHNPDQDPSMLYGLIAERLISGAEDIKLSAPQRAHILLLRWCSNLTRPDPYHARLSWFAASPERAEVAEMAVWARAGARLVELMRAAVSRARARLFAGLVLPMRRRRGLRFLETHVFDAPKKDATTGRLLLELLRAPRRGADREVDDAARGVHEMLGLQPETDVAWCRARLAALRRRREVERRTVCTVLEVFGAAAAAADAFTSRERRRRERHWTEHAHEHWLVPPPCG